MYLPGRPAPATALLQDVLGTWRRYGLSLLTSVLQCPITTLPHPQAPLAFRLFQKDLQPPPHHSMFFIQQTFMEACSRPGAQDTQGLRGLWGRQAQVWGP